MLRTRTWYEPYRSIYNYDIRVANLFYEADFYTYVGALFELLIVL